MYRSQKALGPAWPTEPRNQPALRAGGFDSQADSGGQRRPSRGTRPQNRPAEPPDPPRHGKLGRDGSRLGFTPGCCHQHVSAGHGRQRRRRHPRLRLSCPNVIHASDAAGRCEFCVGRGGGGWAQSATLLICCSSAQAVVWVVRTAGHDSDCCSAGKLEGQATEQASSSQREWPTELNEP